MLLIICIVYSYGDHQDLPLLTHSCPTRRSSVLAAGVPVGAADHRVRAGDNEQFAVTERPGLEADAHAALQQLRELVLGGPTDIRKIVALRQQHDRAHAA